MILSVKNTNEKKSLSISVKLEEGAFMPTKAHEYDGGFDLYIPINYGCIRDNKARIDTGVRIQIPEGYVGFVKPRSSLYSKGIICEGVIDSGYTGTIKVMMHNVGDTDIWFRKGDRIAQLVILPAPKVELVLADKINGDRGDNGFGSSGR